MKIYTEVVYSWDEEKNELVEESSKSYNYEGEVTQCHDKFEKILGKKVRINHSHSSTVDDLSNTLNDLGDGMVADTVSTGLENLGSTVKDPVGATESILTSVKGFGEDSGVSGVVREGIGGTGGDVVNAVYGGSFQSGIESVQQTYSDAEGGLNYYKDNALKSRVTDNSDEVDAAIDALENPEEAEEEGMTPEEIEERRRRLGGSRSEGGSVANRGRSMHVTGTTSAGTILSP